MKQNHIIVKLLMATALIMGGSSTVSAQLGGLKGLANKAKKAATDKAKDAVKSKADDTKSKVVNQASEAAGIPTEDAPDASKVVWRWEDKNAPYYQMMHYAGKDGAYATQVDQLYKVISIIKGEGKKLGNYYDLGDRAAKKVVPVDEVYRYAWTKVFVDNPTMDNFKLFALVLPYQDPIFWADFEYAMDNASTGLVNREANTMLPWANESEMRSERSEREDYALELALRKISLKDACEYTLMQFQRAEKGLQDPQPGFVLGMYVGRALTDYFIKKHKDYNESLDYVREVLNAAQPWENGTKYAQLLNGFRVNATPAQPMPKGVNVDATTKSKGEAAGKTFAKNQGYEYVKTIFLESSWRAFKNTKYPYNVTHHSLKAAVIMKKGDKYVMQQCDLQKSLQGQFSMVQGLGSKLTPVDYK